MTSEEREEKLMAKYLNRKFAWIVLHKPHWVNLEIIIKELNEEAKKENRHLSELKACVLHV